MNRRFVVVLHGWIGRDSVVAKLCDLWQCNGYVWVWMVIYFYLQLCHSIKHPFLRMKILLPQCVWNQRLVPDIPPTVHIREMFVRAADLAVYHKLTIDIDAGLHFPSKRYLAHMQVQSPSSWLHTKVYFSSTALFEGVRICCHVDPTANGSKVGAVLLLRFTLVVFMQAEGPMMKIMREAMPQLQPKST